MPTTGPQQLPLPRNWKKHHHDIYRNMKGTEDNALIFRTLLKYERLKRTGAKDPPKEVIDAHIEVARFILEKERCIPHLDEIIRRCLKTMP